MLLFTRVGPRNHVLDRGSDPTTGKGIFWGAGEGHSIVKNRDTLRSSVQKRLN